SAGGRTADAARRTAVPLGCAARSAGSAARPFGTRSPVRPAAGVPPPDGARPDHDGGRRVQGTAVDNAGSALATPGRLHPPAQAAAAPGTSRDDRVGRRASVPWAALSPAAVLGVGP